MPVSLLRLIAGLSTRYRSSALTTDGPGMPRGPSAGDRFPDARVRLDGQDRWLHQVLQPPGLQLVCCGDGPWPHAGLEALRSRYDGVVHIRHLRAHPGPGIIEDAQGRALARLGVTASAVYVVRPDGYVAYRSGGPRINEVERYLARWLPGCLREQHAGPCHPPARA